MIYCISQGVPQDDLILEEKSSNTEENIRNAKAIMDGRGMASAIIVSDPLELYCIGYRCARVFGASSMAGIRFMAFRAGVIR